MKHLFPVSPLALAFFICLITFSGSNAQASSLTADGNQINPDGSQTFSTHSLAKKLASSTYLYDASATETIPVEIALPSKDPNGLQSLLQAQYDPASPSYHKWITPKIFAQQFGPSDANLLEVKEFLSSQGLSVTNQLGFVLHAQGREQNIEKTFKIHKIKHYQDNISGKTFYAPDTDITIPAQMVGNIIGVRADNVPLMEPRLIRPQMASANGSTAPGGAMPNVTGGTGPGGGLAPNDIRTAYNINALPWSSTGSGAGQTIALCEWDAFTPSDITQYEAKFGLPNVNIQVVPVDGGVSTPGSGADEVTLDIELAAAIAPQSTILVYEGNFNEYDVLNQIVTDDKAKSISTSWGWMIAADSFMAAMDNLLFQQMASQGQSFFAASGDTDNEAYTEPATSPYVTTVGGTNLSLNSNSTYNSESGPTYGFGEVTTYPIPSWQTTVAAAALPAAQVSTTYRNIPDVSLNSSGSYSIYYGGGWKIFAGTSCSAPLWAAFTALINQGLGANGTLGFANTPLYALADNATSYAADFHDVKTGTNGLYHAEAGFDLATGLGSFNGLNLYNALVSTAYTLSVSASNGTVSQSVNGTSSSSPYSPNTVVTLTATPASGYQFSSWSGGATGTTSPTTVTMQANTSVTANFTQIPPTYTLTVSAGSNGSISPSGTLVVNSGASQTFTVTPNAGYIPSLTVDGSAVALTNNSYTLTNITANHTIAASFALQTETITASAGANGSITPSGAVNVNYGGSQAFTVTPNAGYTASLTVDGNAVALTNNSYTLTNVIANHTVAASFALQTETINTSAGANGSITPSGTVKVNYGTSQIFTVTPEAGYTASLTVDGSAVALTNNSYTLTNVTANHTVAASFALQTETITASAGANGSITPSGAISVNYGGSQAFSITPNNGYQIDTMTIDGVPLTGNLPSSYTFSNVLVNHSIAVTFAQTAATYSLNITSNYGTVTANPNQSSYKSGSVVTLTDTCNSSYVFGSWSGDVTSKTNPVQVTVTKNMNITAQCNVDTAPVIIPGDYPTLTPSSFPAALTLSNTIVNYNGLYPLNLKTTWSASGVTFANPNQVQTTATFNKAGVYTLNLTATDGVLSSSKQIEVVVNGYNLSVNATNGTVVANPSNQYSYAQGQVVTLTATPNSGYTAVSWSSNVVPSASNPLVATVTMNGNVTVTATFSALSANAGSNQNVTSTLPAAITLNGSVKGATSSLWTVDPASTGTGTVSFANANSPVTTAQVSAAGSYIFDLTASNGAQSLTSSVTENVAVAYKITTTAGVIKSPNQTSYAAGTVVTLTPPVTLGTGEFLNWTGDVNSTSNPLTVTVNNNMNITAVFNNTPVVSAGGNQTMDMPVSGNPVSVNLSGTVKDDGLPSPSSLTSTWSVVSYSGSANGNVTFATSSQNFSVAANTSVAVKSSATFSSPGTYVIQLAANDTQLTGTSTMTVTVNPANEFSLNVVSNNSAYGTVSVSPQQALYAAGTQVTLTAVATNAGYAFSAWSGNASGSNSSVTVTVTKNMSIGATFKNLNTAPIANAGSNQSITLPATVALSGTVTDDGFPINPGTLTATWSKYSGPGNVSFSHASQSFSNAANTPVSVNSTASFSAAGSYVLKLVANDGQLNSLTSYVTVSVGGVPTYPVNIDTTNGSVSLSPSQPVAGYPAGTKVTITAHPASGYLFDSWGGDASSLSGTPAVYIVNSSSNNIVANFVQNVAPIALPGIYDAPVSLSSGGVLNLTGKISTVVPSSVQVTWKVVSGPKSVSISSASQTIKTTADNTLTAVNATATFTATGNYVMELIGTANGLTAAREAEVVVAAKTTN